MPRKKGPLPPEYWKKQYELQKARGETKDQLERQKARREYDKKGIDRKGKDIDHIKPIRAGGKTSSGNLRLRDPSANQADNAHGSPKRKSTKAKN
jgi:hypothetical protein